MQIDDSASSKMNFTFYSTTRLGNKKMNEQKKERKKERSVNKKWRPEERKKERKIDRKKERTMNKKRREKQEDTNKMFIPFSFSVVYSLSHIPTKYA